MRKTFTKHFLVMGALVLFSSLSVQAQNVFKTTSQSKIGYLEYVPADYNSNSNKYPVVIFLHGIGERGPNTTDVALLEAAIWSVDNLGPPRHAKDGTQFPFILISPQLKNNYSSWPSSYVMEVINHVKSYLRIDERRIHITGLSLGGYGAWTMLQDYPKLFATGSPVCGGYNQPSKACGIAAENVPVWAFHGDKDNVVNMSMSVNMVNAINACTPKPSPLAKLTIYAGVAHDAWNKAYAPNHTYHNPNVYEWLMPYVNTRNAGNQIPIANAGTDRTVSTTSVSIAGSATDDGTIASYVWTKMSGSSVTMTNASTNTLSLAGLSNGTYLFKLQVTDNSGNTDSDYVKLTVNVSSNQAPVANAGADVNVSYPTTSATLAGSGTDADGSISSYAWKLVSGPATPTLANAATKTVTVSNVAVAGTYVLSLTVTDDKGATDTDNVSIKVNATPVANAGADKTITLPTSSVTIYGSGTDDGTITAYKWSLSRGPTTPTMTNNTTATLSVSGMTVAGQYTFALKVTDNQGLVDYDHVSIHVQDGVASAASMTNSAPVANAGSDKTLVLPTSSVTLYGSGTDDGSIVSYKWALSKGPKTPTMNNPYSATLSVSGMTVAGQYTFALKVTDNQGMVDYDHVSIHVSEATAAALSGATFVVADPAAKTNVSGDQLSTEKIEVDFSNQDASYWQDKLVSVYDGNGSSLYSGQWSAAKSEEVFSQAGLYIYKVYSKDAEPVTGKMFIRH